MALCTDHCHLSIYLSVLNTYHQLGQFGPAGHAFSIDGECSHLSVDGTGDLVSFSIPT